MNDSVVITYSGQQVSVPKEVADFLEQDRKREQAQDKRDHRHLSKSEFETVLFCSDCVRRPVEDTVLRNLQLETSAESRRWILETQGRDLVELRYGQGIDHGGDRDDLRRVQGGGIKAAEKAPRTAEGLCHLTEPLNFLFFWFTNRL